MAVRRQTIRTPSKGGVRVKKNPKWLYILVSFVIAFVVIGGYFLTTLNSGLDVDDMPQILEPNGDSIIPNDPTNPTPPGGSQANAAKSARKEGVYNFLIVGTDISGANTDTMLVASFDTKNDKINILQIPRDTLINTTRKSKKINASYSAGGIDGLEKDIERLLGIPIDRYGVVSTKAFRNIVDAVDGVTITVPQDMLYLDIEQGLDINLKAGKQKLNGAQAEGFVRYRSGYADADLGRLKAQKAFISAFIKKLISAQTVLKIPQLADSIVKNVKTDLKLNDIIFLGGQALEVGSENIKFFTLPGEPMNKNGVSYVGTYKEETLQMINESFNPYNKPITSDMQDIVPFTRKLTTAPNISGSNLDEASNAKLSTIMPGHTGDAKLGTVKPSQQDVKLPPESGGEVAPKDEPQQVHTPEPSNPSDPDFFPDAVTVTGVFEKSTPKVEIINSTKDKEILENVKTMVESLGYNVVRAETSNNIVCDKTTIINKSNQKEAQKLAKTYTSAKIKDEINAKATVDATIIIGTDLLS